LTAVLRQGDLIFLVTEICNGDGLLSWIIDRRIEDSRTLKELFRQFALGVQYLHDKGIARNDIKPENVIIDSDGNAKLLDFGFAKQLQFAGHRDQSGTPSSAAPEILRGGRTNQQKLTSSRWVFFDMRW
jgi:serine/threonine protein kinase